MSDAPATPPPEPPPAEATAAPINRTVFIASALLILSFVAFGALAPDAAARAFGAVQGWITAELGWFYLLAVAGFVIFVALLAFGGSGRIRLGPNHSEPEFRYTAWFAMLFSAGMGIGLVFFGVAEPVTHFLTPPEGEPASIAAARNALRLSYFHWGLHAWAIYAVVGLSLAYFSFRHGLPLTVRSALYPLIGDRIRGPIGDAVDVFAVIGTMFGVATSLGLGALQVNAGLSHVLGVPVSFGVQLALIAGITALATLSVASGLDKGIKLLSNANLLMATALMLFVFAVGPTTFLLRSFVQNLGGYIDQFALRTFNMYAYDPKDWLADWTLFYWGWWIAWSPFVGMFIARISRGRTIREFVLGVLLVPAGFTFAWMTVFGDSALWLHLSGTTTAVSQAVQGDVTLALFAFLEQFPLATISSWLAMLLIVTFFITSADSAALVVSTITAGGRDVVPLWQRVFWAVASGLIAAVLLASGEGLKALQTAAIASALPFAVVMLLMAYGLWRALQREGLRQDALAQNLPPRQGRSWQRQLQGILAHPTRQAGLGFVANTAAPALEAVAAELRGRGLSAEVEAREDRLRLVTMPGAPEEFRYGIRLRRYAMPSFAYFESRPEQEQREHYWRAEVFLEDGSQDYDVMDLTREELIQDVLSQYERHFQFLHASRAL
ncbi:BCCT family transporter [Pseudoroseomonas cervicalis]|uniref:BCCT family transporter n=1 Tax=Teichococcus cervicalis TaxID=204525 RepID=UPI0022F1D1B8|nr:BCCT family transporter [Pseudoroseomonas cervicalis]WBV42864.1 BCCT family transporter [Pseudoroseomonas cervicalis]